MSSFPFLGSLGASISLVVTLAPLAVAPLACSSSDSSSGTAASACSSVATAYAECGGFGQGPGVQLSETACVEALALPGSPPASAYQACANALAATSCANGGAIAECDLRGSLAAGADCNSGVQCQSGACTIPAGATCGTCAAVIADGQACPPTGGCRAGAACIGGACTALTYGGVGVQCDGLTQLCQSNLYCPQVQPGAARTCAAPPANGQTCGRSSAFGLVCAPPYVCGSSDTCVTGGGAGAPCPCAFGFTCSQSPSGATCTSSTGLAPGQTCTQYQRCATGTCDLQTLVCPAVLADGQACQAGSATAVCGLASTCSNGTCVSVATTVAVCK